MSDKEFTDEQIIDALMQTGGVQAEAARLLGCDRITIWRRSQVSEAVQAAIDLGLEELADEAHVVTRDAMKRRERVEVYEDGESVGVRLLEEPDKIAADTAKWVLARLRKGKFSERQELTGADGAPMAVQIIWPDAPEQAEDDE